MKVPIPALLQEQLGWLPLHPRALLFKTNERRLFISHFSVFLFHLITDITTGLFSLLLFIANV